MTKRGKSASRSDALYHLQSLKNIGFQVFEILHSKAEANQVVQDTILGPL